ncbi:unnamed protein product [Closterium sp. Yama58-4]|nr:unnamed protein product [Closterium sp. Yama58-4]
MSDESPIQRLSDDLLAKILQLAGRPDQFLHSLVCTKWRDIAYLVQDAIHVSSGTFLNHRQLLDQLAAFPRLKKLVVSEDCLSFVPDVFLAGLAHSHPDLVQLHIKAVSDFTTEGLSNLLEGCTKLEDLRLACPPRILSIPPSISLQSQLRSLVLTIEGVAHLPDAITSLQLLENLKLSMANLQDLPQNFGNLVSLKTLSLGVRSLRSLPTSIQQLVDLQQLSISHCRTFRLPDGLSKLKRLKMLELIDFAELLPLPEDFGKLLALECLVVRRVRGIRALPETVGLLPQLQLLTIESRDSSSWLPRSLPNLTSLTELNLRVPCVSELPDDIGRLSKLKSMKLVSSIANRLRGISSLPEDFGRLTALEILRLSELKHLSHLPESFGHLIKLQDLRLQNCEQLRQLPCSFTLLSSLRKLEINNCSSLKPALPSVSLRTNQAPFTTTKPILSPLSPHLPLPHSPPPPPSPLSHSPLPSPSPSPSPLPSALSLPLLPSSPSPPLSLSSRPSLPLPRAAWQRGWWRLCGMEALAVAAGFSLKVLWLTDAPVHAAPFSSLFSLPAHPKISKPDLRAAAAVPTTRLQVQSCVSGGLWGGDMSGRQRSKRVFRMPVRLLVSTRASTWDGWLQAGLS